MNRIKVGVIGVGYLGRQHVRIYSQLDAVELVGVVDKNPAIAESVAREFHIAPYSNYEEILGKVSAVSLAVPTIEHSRIGCRLMSQGIDVLVEKPIASSVTEAEALIQAAYDHQRVLQVGHLERFNPAVLEARKMLNCPLFFEVHRLGVFTSRSLDIDVVFDLMIHDLDIVLDFVGSPVRAVSAVGLPILSSKIDIANARIEFANGCVANVTASRVSSEKVRKLRFFQPNEYLSIDYSRQDIVVMSVKSVEQGEIPIIVPKKIALPKAEPLRAEIESFLKSVKTRCKPEVTAEESKLALELGQRVVERIREHAQALQLPVFSPPRSQQA
jgi:predicted dehydrogenase